MDRREMGNSCSMQQRNGSDPSRNIAIRKNAASTSSRSKSPRGRRYSRHSVVSQLPDKSIANLYPTSDNFRTEKDGTRSPKSLAELCTDTLCRSLPCLDGSLPPGLPQEIVDDVVASLVKHSALNATTLRVLRNCELFSLSLSGCRGVSDDWLEPLSSTSASSSRASTPQLGPSCPSDEGCFYHSKIGLESMDLDDCGDHGGKVQTTSLTDEKPPAQVFYSASFNRQLEESKVGVAAASFAGGYIEESSCSTSSFLSASSTPLAASPAAASPGGWPFKNCDDNQAMMEDEGYGVSSNHYGDTYIPCVTSNLYLLDLRGSQKLTDKGLLHLSDLSNLQVAQLDHCFSIVGCGLLAFSNSPFLHTISLSNCRSLTDEALVNFSHLVSLETLVLNGCRCLTDRSLAAISGLFRMKKLDMSQCDLITDDGLEELQDLTELEELSLGWCRSVTDIGIETLASQRGRSKCLRVLSLARIAISESGVGHLAKLKELDELDLSGCNSIGSAALGQTLEQLTKLTRLDVSYCPGILRSSWQGKVKELKALDVCYSAVRDSHLSRITDLPALEELNLDSCPIGDWALAHLADNSVVPNLLSLDLSDTDVSDLGMVHIAKFKKLKRLSLFYCRLSNSALRHLSQLSDLETLNLDSRDIGDSAIWHLRGLKKLKSLDLFSARITDSGCTHIAKIKSLESLELCGGGISDVGATILASLENLTSLNLSQNDRITNRGAAALAALSNLKALNLSNTRVNSGALIHFSDLRNLKSLALYGCSGIDEEDAIDKLHSGLPNLKCIRLNNGPDDDGMIVVNEEDTDDEDLDLATNRAGMAPQRIPVPFHDSDSDSDMQDAMQDEADNDNDEEADGQSSHGDDNSDASWSDHDFHH